ncbi:MAG TPA: PASTA domain-containing protein [Pilimelia sp.]|nr:PASTA domain-containing protein [Pilimelia sp.]
MSERNAAEAAPAARRQRTWLVAGIAAAAVVLAVAGVTGGWLLAGPGPDRRGSDSAAGAPPAPPVTPPPTADGSRTATPSPSRPSPRPPGAGQIRVPDLAGLDFVRARQRLREQRLGWQLVFAEHGTDRTVARTDPPAGTTVRRGTTVTLYVRGAAPPATVPGVVGLTCRRAGALVVEHGLYPQYPTGQAGRVVRQDPEPPGEVRWNDRVKLYCGVDEPTPSPTSRPV